MKTLLNLIVTVGGIYLFLVLLAYVLQDRMLFFPTSLSAQARDRLRDHEIRFDHHGTELHGWLFRREEAAGLPFLIYYGGNGEEVSWNVPRFAELPLSGYLLVNYRGYGDSGGRPSATALLADAAFIYDELVAREGIAGDDVVLMGRSLESGVAVDLAARRPAAGLILVTPFDRLSSIASHHYPILPVRWLLRHEMDSLGHAPGIAVPSLVVVAERDATAPAPFGRRLYGALAGPAKLVSVAGADHNDLDGYAEYWRAVEELLKQIAADPSELPEVTRFPRDRK